MPRISQDQTQERHAFLLDLFRSQPELSRQEAMDAYKVKFGATINLKTLTQLRDQVQAEKDSDSSEADEPSQDEETPAEDAASRLKAAAGHAAGNSAPKAAPKAAKGGKQKNVFVDASKEQLDFLQRIVGQLQEAGASNLRIDHSTDRWMVVVVEAK